MPRVSYDNYLRQCQEMIHQACHEDGIYASPSEQDNYKRVWARDSIITGIAGIILQDETIIDGLKNSLESLAKHQLAKGTIPSNVQSNPTLDVSHGSLVGRVDATSWFIIGVCLYATNQDDLSFYEQLKSQVEKAEYILECWEFNDKHLVYTPLSGNWADEYVFHGYLLYDNCLRLWALKLIQALDPTDQRKEKIEQVKTSIIQNFWPEAGNDFYHPILANKHIGQSNYFLAGFNPARYYTQFDAAGNALALMLLAKEKQVEKIVGFVQELKSSLNHTLIPAHWPPIKEGDTLWEDLKENYNYDFKNEPYVFHNGGIWPVMMGLFALGLQHHDKQSMVKDILNDYLQIENQEELSFSEYIRSDNMRPSGKKPLCFTAAGIIFMIQASIATNTEKSFML